MLRKEIGRALFLLGSLMCISATIDIDAETFQTTIDNKDAALIMFYAPWCPHCTNAKPPFTKVATEINKEEGKAMQMVNCDDSKNQALCQKINIEGYPTFKLYGKGKHIQDYEDEPEEDALNSFMKNPPKEGEVRPAAKKDESGEGEDEADTQMTDVTYLGNDNYTSTLEKYDYALVFYYAPWCPHCKDSKPKYEKAAIEFKQKDIKDKVIAAVNCEVKDNQQLCETNKIEGYPTIRLLKKTETWAEFEEEIEAENLIKFISNPPKEKVLPTTEDETAKEGENKEEEVKEEPDEKMQYVKYIEGEKESKEILESKLFVLVMFYAPWCAHCKDAKPVYNAAAQELAKDDGKLLTAANCDAKVNEDFCAKNSIEGFPTFILFENGKKKEDYPESPITTPGVVEYMRKLKSVKDEL